MNVKANKVIMELESVEDMFVFPSCGDEMNASGACFAYAAEHGFGTKNSSPWGYLLGPILFR